MGNQATSLNVSHSSALQLLQLSSNFLVNHRFYGKDNVSVSTKRHLHQIINHRKDLSDLSLETFIDADEHMTTTLILERN